MRSTHRMYMVLMCLVFFVVTVAAAKVEKVPRMSKEQLKEMLNDPDVVVLDVRIDKDWKNSDVKIKGAIREDPKGVKEWAKKLDKKKTYVLYCA